jgi:hypothetical protein
MAKSITQMLDIDFGIEISFGIVDVATISVIGTGNSGMLDAKDIIKLIENLSKSLLIIGINQGKLQLLDNVKEDIYGR